MTRKELKILAIIPGRGGSKGIPSKNMQRVGELPLIAHTILAAKKSNVNKIIVSTDNKKISTIAKKFGAEVPFFQYDVFLIQCKVPSVLLCHHSQDF